MVTGRAARAYVLVSAAWLTVCATPHDVAGCSGDVEISVIRYNPPVISWVPNCGISTLVVADAANQPVWSVHGGIGRNGLVPPVTFGVVPSGATEEIPPGELQHGNFYIVRVFRLVRDRSGELQLVSAGENNFPW